MVPSIVVSLGLHALLIGALVYVPANFSRPRLPPGAITVDLVAMPGPPGPAAGDGAAPAPKPKPVEAPKPPAEKPAVAVAAPLPPPKAVPEVPKPEVSLSPKVKEKKSLKAETKDTQKMIDRAIERIEKKISEPQTGSVDAAIERLKKKYGDSEPASAGREATASAAAGSGGGGGGGGGGSGPIEPVDIYRANIAFQVERNWAFSPQLAGGNKNLKVGLVFKVMPNGEITEIRYTERSGNNYLDDSAYKAIVKSSPVSPHPAAVKAPYVIVAIRFTPEGLR
jgi:colicin import membrane protein